MEVDIFLGTPRWKILEYLANKPSSPSEISSYLKTSVAYVSQQLKLLEAAGLILKEKTGSSEKGKPRSLYSISKEILYMTVLAKGWSAKKLVHVSDYHKLMLRILLIENSLLHPLMNKFYWRIEPYLNEIGCVLFSEKNGNKVTIVSDSKGLKNKMNLSSKDFAGLSFYFMSKEELASASFSTLDHFVLYDPHFLLNSKEAKVKGGNKQ